MNNDEAIMNSPVVSYTGLVANLSTAYQRHVALAAHNNNLAAVPLMLAAGLPVHALGQHRAALRHWVAFHGNAQMTSELLRWHPPLELTDAGFKGAPLGWAIHGSENGWHCESGDYVRTVELLLQAGTKLPEKIGGTDAVKALLRRYGLKDDGSK